MTNARVNKWLAAHDFDLLHLHEPITPSASVIALLNAPDDLPVVATAAGQGVPGETVNVRLTEADPAQRRIAFELLG